MGAMAFVSDNRRIAESNDVQKSENKDIQCTRDNELHYEPGPVDAFIQ